MKNLGFEIDIKFRNFINREKKEREKELNLIGIHSYLKTQPPKRRD